MRDCGTDNCCSETETASTPDYRRYRVFKFWPMRSWVRELDQWEDGIWSGYNWWLTGTGRNWGQGACLKRRMDWVTQVGPGTRRHDRSASYWQYNPAKYDPCRHVITRCVCSLANKLSSLNQTQRHTTVKVHTKAVVRIREAEVWEAFDKLSKV